MPPFAAAVLLGALAAVPTAHASAPVITLAVDARQVGQRILHVQETVQAGPGPLTLHYPKWLPGEHGPTGPINDLVGLQARAAGRRIPWVRDDEDPYTFRLDVPAGATRVDLTFDFVTAAGGRGVLSPATASDRLAIIKWNDVVMYPAGLDLTAPNVAASVAFPAGWRLGTALPVAAATSNGARFAPVSLTTLIDSPVAAAAFARTLPLGPSGGAPAHTLRLFADSAEALLITEGMLGGYRRLVVEAGALFGGYPYDHYDFLLSLSDHVPHGGLEHHESSDNRMWERSLIDDARRTARAGLLPHELVHAWNGKTRRPAGLVTPDYQHPFHTELLWVYEGLTTYLGEVLTARSGLRNPQTARDALAVTAAGMLARPGRSWRSVADTAVAAPWLSDSPREWRGWRRGLDYYPEAQLVWLEADVIIRTQSGGTRSLDDFCRAFHGAHAQRRPQVVPYVLDDVVAALNQVAAYDWRSFFRKRIYEVNPEPPFAGLEAAGWRLSFDDKPTRYHRRLERAANEIDLTFSLGAALREDFTVIDVLPGSAAAQAGLAPAMKLVAVNGRRVTRDVLRAALRATASTPNLELLVDNDDQLRTLHVAYKGGDRFPRLTRIAGRPDLLAAIFAARTPATEPAAADPTDGD